MINGMYKLATNSLCYNDGTEFATAKATAVKETTFRDLTAADKEGHENFASDEEMYATYSRYYRVEVTPETNVKVIKFRIIS